MFIAIEEHWTTPELTAALTALPERSRDESLAFNEMGDNLTRLQDIGDARIAAMDEQGIDLQVLSLAPPATGPLAAADAVPLARDTNDLAAEAVRRHPTRFKAMATLPMAQPSAVAGELERAAGLGLVGAMVYGRTAETALDDPRYEDLFATALRNEDRRARFRRSGRRPWPRRGRARRPVRVRRPPRSVAPSARWPWP
ncbi:MAG TPA: amidohydrolase family protein [Pseudonocardiaceae bacterium]|nr:amidohydrolase family protein [Pseudonocardiaceae bacterium]